MQRSILIITFILFGALTGVALWQQGYWGIIAPHFQSFGAAQVLVDLVIASLLAIVWMWQDAKTVGRNPWPWIAITLVAGSFGPLAYLITREPLEEVEKAG